MTPPARRPYPDANSLHAVLDAIETLAMLRGIRCPITDPDQPHDPADPLHLAWSLSLHIDVHLPELITAARDHGYSWHHIHDLLTPPATRSPTPLSVTNPRPPSDTNPDDTTVKQRG